MTRINCVPPSELSGKHLVAEYRELPRIFGLARATATIPATYRLGPGHVTFFYDKLTWLKRRHKALVNEMLSRGYKPQFTEPPWPSDPSPNLWNDWTPTEEALALNRQRIADRSGGVANV